MKFIQNYDVAIEACCHNRTLTSQSFLSFLLRKILHNLLTLANIGFLIYLSIVFYNWKNTNLTLICDEVNADSAPIPSPQNDVHQLDYLERVKAKIKCYDKPNDFKIINHGNFWIFKNYVRASESPAKCHETVTLTTQGDFSFLDNVETLVERWRAPISIAVYCPGKDFKNSLASILHLRNCLDDRDKSALIKKHVTFHFYFDRNHTYENIDVNFDSVEQSYICSSHTPPYLMIDASETSYRRENKLFYPINVGRNIAREAATTHFVLASDIELYPNYDIPQRFLKMYADWDSTNEKEVFVLTVFEVEKNFTAPTNKTVLAQMIKNETAQMFHDKLGKAFHYIQKTEEWLELPPSSEMAVTSTFIREGKSIALEPFYIGTNSDPLFDEHIHWEGKHNKLTQAFIMCMSRFDYHVLNEAFLVHKPGIKTQDNALRFEHTYPMFTYIKEVVAPQYKAIFGSEERCYLHNNE